MAPPLAGKIYRRLLRLALPYRMRLGGAVLSALVTAAAASSYAYLLGPLLASLLRQGPVSLPGLSLPAEKVWALLPWALLATSLFKALGGLLQQGLMNGVGQGILFDLRRELYAHLLQLPPRFFEQRHSGELLSRFTSDVAQVEFAVTQALASYVKDGLQLLALLGVCLYLDPGLFVLAFVVLPATAYPVSRFARSLKKVARSTQGSLGQLTELLAEALQNLPLVSAYRAQGRALATFEAESARYRSAMSRSLFLRGAFTPTLELLGIAGTALAVGAGARAVGAHPDLSAKLLSFLAAALLMYQPLKALSGTFSLVVAGLGAAERLYEIVDHPRVDGRGDACAPLSGALEFSQVRASYGDGREALAGLSFTVPAGKTTALVGSSGGGKSSTFSTLLGFLPTSQGAIHWDGQPLETLAVASRRGQMAWVPQEARLFSGTLRENLLLGLPTASEASLWEALRRAHAEAFVRAFPAGLDQEVGEGGGRLSGGQRQRIAIARAFLRQPSLLLLDEPTSALDAFSEKEVQSGLAELMKGRTTLVIAHRLATVKDADQIVVLEGGRAVEWGNHSQLMAQGQRYPELLRQGELT